MTDALRLDDAPGIRSTWTKALVLDTETTGLPIFSEIIDGQKVSVAADDPRQPRLCGISAALFDAETWLETNLLDALVKPDGWTFDDNSEAAKINGLTAARLNAEGKPIEEILASYNALLDQCDLIVCYSLTFDMKMMRGALRRSGMPDRYAEKPVYDVLITCRQLLKGSLPKGQRCTLVNAHAALIGQPFDGAHSSLADMRATARLLRHLNERGMVLPRTQFIKEEPQ